MPDHHGYNAGNTQPGLDLSALAKLPRWVAWQTIPRGPRNRPTKVPFTANCKPAKSDDPGTWGTRAEAEAWAKRLPMPMGAGGVGIVFGDHDGLAIGGIDLDTCRTGEAIEPWAEEVVARFGSYAEVSPSGTGAKVLFTVDAAVLAEVRERLDGKSGKVWKQATGTDHPPAIELYLGGRFFAVTDQGLATAPAEVRQVEADDLAWLIDTAGPAFGGAAKAKAKGAKAATGDGSRSARAFKVAAEVKRAGGGYDDFKAKLEAEPDTAEWLREKGLPNGERECRRTWVNAGDAVDDEVLLTEHGVALAFMRRQRNDLRFCHDTGAWFLWTGTHWRQDRKHTAFSFARDLIAEHNREAEFKTQAITGKAAFAAGVERFARSDQALAVTAEDWDTDPWLLATPGGTVDLRTGTLQRARPSDMMTRVTATAPAATADCPRWLRFMDEVTAKDAKLIRFIQQWCGYSLTGDTREQALLFGYGQGGNGKGVLLNTVSRIMGDYAMTATMEAFTASSGDKHSTDLAMLRGARMVTASETEEGRAWAEARIKQVTGGDPITARFMRRDNFTYLPQFKLTIIGNHKPVLRNVDDATRRRFNIVPFLHKPEVIDLQLEATLRREWPGILRWMIEGCLDWQRHKLTRPPVVVEATAEYFEAQDTMAHWLAERCEEKLRAEAPSSALYRDWATWAKARGEEPGTNKAFSAAMERRYPKKKTKTGAVFEGLHLRPSDTGVW
jgi:putative DNA primase/helicase